MLGSKRATFEQMSSLATEILSLRFAKMPSGCKRSFFLDQATVLERIPVLHDRDVRDQFMLSNNDVGIDRQFLRSRGM